MRNPQAVMKAGVRSRFQGDREKKQAPKRPGKEAGPEETGKRSRTRRGRGQKGWNTVTGRQHEKFQSI